MTVTIDEAGRGNVVEVDRATIFGNLEVRVRGNGNAVRIGAGCGTREETQTLLIEVEGDGNEIDLGQRVRLGKTGHVQVLGHRNRVRLGDRCTGQMNVRVKSSGSSFSMGSHTTAVGARFFVREGAQIRIGEDCMFSANVRIFVTDMHPIFDLASGERINPGADVTIGDHVWLGFQTTVLKGANVGSGSVIGTGAVVSGDIPENCVAGGVPASVLRRDVFWTREMPEAEVEGSAISGLASFSLDDQL